VSYEITKRSGCLCARNVTPSQKHPIKLILRLPYFTLRIINPYFLIRIFTIMIKNLCFYSRLVFSSYIFKLRLWSVWTGAHCEESITYPAAVEPAVDLDGQSCWTPTEKNIKILLAFTSSRHIKSFSLFHNCFNRVVIPNFLIRWIILLFTIIFAIPGALVCRQECHWHPLPLFILLMAFEIVLNLVLFKLGQLLELTIIAQRYTGMIITNRIT